MSLDRDDLEDARMEFARPAAMRCGVCTGWQGSHFAGCPEAIGEEESEEEPFIHPCPDCKGEGQIVHGGALIACSNCDGLGGITDDGEPARQEKAHG